MSDTSLPDRVAVEGKGANINTAEQNLLDLLPKRWQQTLKRELELIKMESALQVGLLKSRVAGEKQFLAQWLPGPPSDALQEYPQSDIAETELKIDNQQKELEGQRDALTIALEEVRNQAQENTKAIKDAADDFQELIKELKALPEAQEKAKKAVEQLESRLAAAEGKRAELIEPDVDAAKAKYERLKSPAHHAALKAAIEEAFVAWQEAQDALLHTVVTGDATSKSQEELEVEIKQIDTKLGYFKQHRSALILNGLKQSAKAW